MLTINKSKENGIRVRVTENEKKIVTERAAELGMNVSDYLRTLINKDLEK